MTEDPAPSEAPEVPAPDDDGHSRSRHRLLINGVLVAVDAPSVAEHPWVVDAIDVNSTGMGLVLPPEVPEGTPVQLSFALSDEYEFSSVPAAVRHKEGLSGGVRFEPWDPEDRRLLLEFLVWCYEVAE